MKIYTYGNPVLRKKAKSVQHFDLELKRLCKDMLKAMHNSQPRGVGLAAPQVGISLRLIVVEHQPGNVKCLANPEILSSEGNQIDTEGCLSVPGVYANVKRADRILVRAIDPETHARKEFYASGFLSRIIQHEIDHLDGVMFTDYFDDLSSFDFSEDVAIPEALLKRYQK